MTYQSQPKTFGVHGEEIHTLDPRDPDLNSNNESWKTPVRIKSYLKQEIILQLFEFFNNTVNIGTNVNTSVLLTSLHSITPRY